ncbi:MAG: nucleotidyltransferase domain-containing protein [Candidatus Omnitrophica bacterium]|nr:nucleotidyltransferase domain-containing protein [Candidatus Omnitrophota bacterium]
MISETDKKIIKELSKKYHVKLVLLFGSSLDPAREGQDIDLAVDGIDPRKFFKYYGDLMLSLSKPVDLIDLSEPSKFVSLVKKEGVPIYG